MPGAETGRPLPRRPGQVSWLTLVVQLGTFVVVLGIPEGIVGVLWPSMRASFHLPLDDLGVLTVASATLYTTGGLVANRLRVRLGAGNALAVSCGVALVGLTVWSGAPSWLLLLGAVALLGGSRGVIDAVLNAEAALDGGVRRLGLLHGSWAIGGTLGPLLVAAVLVWAHDWRWAVVVVAVGVLGLMVLAIIDRHPDRPTVPAGTEPIQPASATGATGVASVPKVSSSSVTNVPSVPGAAGGGPAASASSGSNPDGRAAPAEVARSRWPFVLTMAVFVAYTAAESGPIAWGYTYLIADRHTSRTVAALGIASYWAALTAGRFGLAAVDDRLAGTAVLEASCLFMVAGTGLFWLLPGSLAMVGLPIAGLGAAAVFPLLVSMVPARLGQAATGRAVGLFIASASVAGPAAVATFGVLAAHLGVGALGACLFAVTPVLYVANRVLTIATSGATP